MCIPEPQLLRLIAGELSDSERAAIEAHLAACPSCREAHDELRRTWAALGQWPAPNVPADTADRILAAAARPASPPRAPWLRIAAAILVASGLGIAAGFAVPQTPRTAARQVPTEEVVQSLGLDVLGSDTGLTDSVFDSDATEDLQ